MRLGISSWTYPWSCGVTGFTQPAHPLTLADLLDRAAELRVGVVQVADNLSLHKLDVSELREVCAQAASLSIVVEVGTRGVDPSHLRHYLALAVEFKASVLRTLIDTPQPDASLEQTEKSIRAVVRAFEGAGVTLALENYERYSCDELAALIRRLETRRVGICLDTVNSLGALETPERVVEALAPWTVNLHVKDFTIERVPQKMGFLVSGAPAGEGRLNIPWLLGRMNQINPQMSAILEQWPPQAESVEAAVLMERQWAEKGIRYLRSCGCT